MCSEIRSLYIINTQGLFATILLCTIPLCIKISKVWEANYGSLLALISSTMLDGKITNCIDVEKWIKWHSLACWEQLLAFFTVISIEKIWLIYVACMQYIKAYVQGFSSSTMNKNGWWNCWLLSLCVFNSL